MDTIDSENQIETKPKQDQILAGRSDGTSQWEQPMIQPLAANV